MYYSIIVVFCGLITTVTRTYSWAESNQPEPPVADPGFLSGGSSGKAGLKAGRTLHQFYL